MHGPAGSGRGGRIRTDDLMLPKHVRYQAALRPADHVGRETDGRHSRSWPHLARTPGHTRPARRLVGIAEIAGNRPSSTGVSGPTPGGSWQADGTVRRLLFLFDSLLRAAPRPGPGNDRDRGGVPVPSGHAQPRRHRGRERRTGFRGSATQAPSESPPGLFHVVGTAPVIPRTTFADRGAVLPGAAAVAVDGTYHAWVIAFAGHARHPGRPSPHVAGRRRLDGGGGRVARGALGWLRQPRRDADERPRRRRRLGHVPRRDPRQRAAGLGHLAGHRARPWRPLDAQRRAGPPARRGGLVGRGRARLPDRDRHRDRLRDVLLRHRIDDDVRRRHRRWRRPRTGSRGPRARPRWSSRGSAAASTHEPSTSRGSSRRPTTS